MCRHNPIKESWSRYGAGTLALAHAAHLREVSARSSTICVAHGYGNLTGLVSAPNLALAGFRLLIVNTLNPASNKHLCVTRLPLPFDGVGFFCIGVAGHYLRAVPMSRICNRGFPRQPPPHSGNPFAVES